jgi:RNA polymerase sigma-70 factor, ECF subfamily
VTFFSRGDADLLQRFRDGETKALEAVYRAYIDSVARAVAGALRRYVGEGWQGGWREVATEVPDLVQEVFTRAFEPAARRRFDGVREYGPYLARIAHNVVVDYLRRRQRQVVRDPGLLVEWLHLATLDRGEPFGDLETMALVSQYVARLPADLRRIHEAMYVEGLSQREAASALGLGRQVVRTLESRLREGLRRALGEGGHQEAPGDVAAPACVLLPSDEKVR